MSDSQNGKKKKIKGVEKCTSAWNPQEVTLARGGGVWHNGEVQKQWPPSSSQLWDESTDPRSLEDSVLLFVHPGSTSCVQGAQGTRVQLPATALGVEDG